MLSEETRALLRQSLSHPPRRAARPEKGRNYPVPEVYLPTGTIHVRIYLDVEGKFMRSLYVHKSATIKIPCADPLICPVCQSLSDISSHWDKRWKYTRREICCCYAYISRYDRKRRRVPLNEPVLLWGYKKFGDRLSEIVADLSTDEELSRFFTPQELFPLLKIESDEKGVNIGMTLRTRVREYAPPLPESLPSLSQCIYPVNEKPDPELQSRFVKNMRRAYEKRLLP